MTMKSTAACVIGQIAGENRFGLVFRCGNHRLKRSLAKDEVVHHKNGNKTDNRPENLEVMTRAQHMRLHDPKGLRKESTV